MDKNNNHDLTRTINLKAVTKELFNHSAISRADIARNTGLHKSTISSLFKELDDRNYIKRLGRGSSTESGGRKPEIYRFNENYGYVACFNITYAHLHIMFLNMAGHELSYHRIDLANHEILTVMNLINQALEKAEDKYATERGLLGISFSIHAVVDHNKVIHSPYFPLNGIDLREYYEKHYGVPVLIENEANLAAIFERDYANQSTPKNFIVLSVHRGPGIGIIANHQLFSGFRGMVGELGSVKVPNQKGKLQEVGDYCSIDFIQQQLEKATGHSNLSYREIHQLTQHPNAKVEKVLNNTVEIFSQLIINLTYLYGPERIYINSPLLEVIPAFTLKLNKKLQEYEYQVPLKIINGSQYVSLLGAGALIIRHVLGLENVALKFQWSRKID